jgi:hypothetical protein
MRAHDVPGADDEAPAGERVLRLDLAGHLQSPYDSSVISHPCRGTAAEATAADMPAGASSG